MLVYIYSKKGCGRCDKAKDKLKNHFKVEFKNKNLSEYVEFHDGWREDGSISVLAHWAACNRAVPMIVIDDNSYDYAGAMRELKRRKSGKAKQ